MGWVSLGFRVPHGQGAGACFAWHVRRADLNSHVYMGHMSVYWAIAKIRRRHGCRPNKLTTQRLLAYVRCIRATLRLGNSFTMVSLIQVVVTPHRVGDNSRPASCSSAAASAAKHFIFEATSAASSTLQSGFLVSAVSGGWDGVQHRWIPNSVARRIASAPQ